MDKQDTKFNYKPILAVLAAVIIGILIAFYYSNVQSQTQIDFLKQEKDLLVKNLTLMKADVDQLTALDEVNDIELQSSRYRIQQLLDSVGRLNFTIQRFREFKGELGRLAAKNDSLKLKNDYLNYNNLRLAEKYEASKREILNIRSANTALAKAEALKREKIQDINEELRIKKYLVVENTEGSGYRVRSGKEIRTNKASAIKRLNGCITIAADENFSNQEKVLYFQFLGPDMGIIEDDSNTINVHGNVYSKRIEVDFDGKQTEICDYISIPVGSLESGDYFLNVFEDERLLQTSEFQLK